MPQHKTVNNDRYSARVYALIYRGFDVGCGRKGANMVFECNESLSGGFASESRSRYSCLVTRLLFALEEDPPMMVLKAASYRAHCVLLLRRRRENEYPVFQIRMSVMANVK